MSPHVIDGAVLTFLGVLLTTCQRPFLALISAGLGVLLIMRGM